MCGLVSYAVSILDEKGAVQMQEWRRPGDHYKRLVGPWSFSPRVSH